MTIPTGKSKTKRVRQYALWTSMVDRVKAHRTSCASYAGTSISTNFMDYDYFYKWCEEQKGFNSIDENGDKYCLDKDILSQVEKQYSELNCVFVPSKINSFFVKQKCTKYNLPTGVSYSLRDKSYVASIRDADGVNLRICQDKSVEYCADVYKIFKSIIANELAMRYYGDVDERVIKVLQNYLEYYESKEK